MTIRRSILVLFGAALMAASIAAVAGGDAVLLPAGEVPRGWHKDGAPRVYEGQGLYDLIDGGGEIFLELGFEACTVQRYVRGQNQIAAEIYRMTDPAAALGIYLMNCGRETPSPGLEARHTMGPTQLRLVRGRYYILLTGSRPEADLGDALLALASGVIRDIPKTGEPAILTELPTRGLDPASLRIVRGPIGLQALVTLGEGDVLSLRPDATLAAADYSGGRTVMVVRYPSAERAGAAVLHLKAHLDPLITLRDTGEGSLALALPGGVRCEVTRDGAGLRLEFLPAS